MLQVLLEQIPKCRNRLLVQPGLIIALLGWKDSRESKAISSTAGSARSRLVRAVIRARTPSADKTVRLSGRTKKNTISPRSVVTPWAVVRWIPMSFRWIVLAEG